MTIRKRLVYSYMAIFVIPIVMTVFMLFSCIVGLLIYIRSGNHIMAESAFQFINISQVLHLGVFHYLRHDEDSTDFSWVVEMVDPVQNYIIVDRNGELVYRYGNDRLVHAVNEIKESRILKDMDEGIQKEVYTKTEGENYYFLEKQEIRGNNYHLYFVSRKLPSGSDDAIESAVHGVGNFLMFSFVLFIVFTIWFLSKFIIRRIITPLTELKNGAEKMREGDFDIVISHDQNDEFKPAVDAFNMMSKELKKMLLQKEKDEENRKELIASISHDIRTPLTSINAYVEGLLDNVANTPEKQEKYLRIIHKETGVLDRLVEQLFLLSKMDLGDRAVDLRKLDLGQEIQNVIDSDRIAWEQGGAVFHIDIKNNVIIKGNALLTARILENLVSNSIKYKMNDTADIEIGVTEKEGHAVLEISDNGPGVSEESLERLTEAFYRTDKARSKTENGSGLGLAIVARAVSLMEGTIRIHNRKPSGLVVTIEFPLIEKSENKERT